MHHLYALIINAQDCHSAHPANLHFNLLTSQPYYCYPVNDQDCTKENLEFSTSSSMITRTANVRTLDQKLLRELGMSPFNMYISGTMSEEVEHVIIKHFIFIL
jgi:hypothetical protein